MSKRDTLPYTNSSRAEAFRSRRQAALHWQQALVRRLSGLSWGTILAFILPFTLYLLTLAPTIYNLDSAELTTAAATGGLFRATGYPLYIILGYFWSWIPIGDVGYRLNLFSAFAGALTVALAQRILLRLRVGPWATFGALGLLACAPYFWALSIVAEVYTLHTALMAGIILLLLRWADTPTPTRLALFALVLGLSFSHHAATVLLIPGCAWYLLSVAPRKVFVPRAMLLGTVAFLAGLSLYLYLPLRYTADPVFNYAGLYDEQGVFQPINLHTFSGVWWVISGRAFAGQMMDYQDLKLGKEIVGFGYQLWQSFFAIGIGPGLLGFVVLLRRNWRLGGMLALMFAGNAIFYITYAVVDKTTMFLPNYLIWAIWLGVGYQWLLTWIYDHRRSQGIRWNEWVLRGAITGAVVFVTAWNWPLIDRSHDWSTRERGEAMLREAQPNALIFGWWDTVPTIQYLQLVEGHRPDVMAINRFLIRPEAMNRLIAREAARRPVYIDAPPAEVFPSVEAVHGDLLYRLWPRSQVVAHRIEQE